MTTHLKGMRGLVSAEARLTQLADRLAGRFTGVFGRETIDRYVHESFVALAATATVGAHLTVLTERFATDRLTALAQARGAVERDVCEVLFVCVHNAGRSQMTAGLMAQHGGGRVHARSAGSQPSSSIDDTVVTAMAEVGVDLVDAFPKPLTDDVVRAADVVVTMGCGDACPVYPGTRYVDWPVRDPAGLPLAEVRAIRDDLDRRVRDLFAELTSADPSA
ncbi:three-helix bundle dimerization domain-containing protein [Geodermatophilus sp. SYSU D00703]